MESTLAEVNLAHHRPFVAAGSANATRECILSLPKITWRNHYLLGLLSLIYVFNYIDRQIMAILIEPIKLEFGASDTQMGFLTGLVFAVFYSLFGIPLARLADRGNRRNIIAACCGLWSLMTVLCGMAASYLQLALARTGVAVGEAGGTAPSLSLLSDLYPPERRSLVISIFQCGPALGLMLGLSVGGWVAQHHGWRMALQVVGAPGILLAALLWLTTHEPDRGAWEGRSAAHPARDSLVASLGQILRVTAFRWLTLGCCISGVSGYAIGIWNPSFLVRSHGLSLQQAGLLLGLLGGLLATLGTVAGGWLTDRLVSRNAGWQVGVPVLGLAISVPCGLAFFLWPQGLLGELGSLPIPVAFLWYAVFGFFATWWAPPVFAATTKMFDARQRALASSVLVMALTLFGIGGGPLIAGIASDLLAKVAGQESLRYALAVLVGLQVLSAACFVLAIKHYRVRIESMASSRGQ